jgi:phage recombination protein Bet
MNNASSLRDQDVPAPQDADLLQVLQAAIYPGCTAEALGLVLSYCKAAGLDPMHKPLQIIQVVDAQTGVQRCAVVPGIGLYRTIAARCGCAGVDEPEFGPDITHAFEDQEITYPSWCRVTVHRRLATGEIVHFTAKEFWRENVVFERSAPGPTPNPMWRRRPYGQLAKCAEAQALRKAFPEVGSQPVAEELEGKTVGTEAPPPVPAASQTVLMPQRKSEPLAQLPDLPRHSQSPAASGEAQETDLFQGTGHKAELATAGELAYLCRRILNKGLTINAARERAGMAPAQTLDGLTKEQFASLKGSLA